MTNREEYQRLLAQTEAIIAATEGENTASRVGALLRAIVEYIPRTAPGQLATDIELLAHDVEHNVAAISQQAYVIQQQATAIRQQAEALTAETQRATAAEATKPNIHHGEFNAGLITEEGWYDSIVSGRPEGSESDEKYFLYHSGNGGQVCFSRRNSGKAFHRLGKEHPWMPVTRDDYTLQHSAAMAARNYRMIYDHGAGDWAGGSYDPSTDLREVYAGDNLQTPTFHLCQPFTVHPHDILRVRCFYRRGNSRDGIDTYPFDSDAYIYLSDSPERDHSMAHLRSDFIKVQPLGSSGYPFTEEQKNWQDLAFARDHLFNTAGGEEYCTHYLHCHPAEPGTYYLHIAGDFSFNASWFVLDTVSVYSRDYTVYATASALTQETDRALAQEQALKLMIQSAKEALNADIQAETQRASDAELILRQTLSHYGTTFSSLQTKVLGMEPTIPTDVSRSATDATFVGPDRTSPLFYLRSANASLAGLMPAEMYRKIADFEERIQALEAASQS